jgi:hypothetical protein
MSPRDQYVLKITCLSCSGNLEKHFSLQLAPKYGLIFRSGISVPTLKDLYAYPVFRCILVLFLFYSDGTTLSLFLFFGFLFSFSVVKSIFCGSFNAETLISSDEELLLSEVSE